MFDAGLQNLQKLLWAWLYENNLIIYLVRVKQEVGTILQRHRGHVDMYFHAVETIMKPG